VGHHGTRNYLITVTIEEVYGTVQYVILEGILRFVAHELANRDGESNLFFQSSSRCSAGKRANLGGMHTLVWRILSLTWSTEGDLMSAST
jgi:hypothetical protein